MSAEDIRENITALLPGHWLALSHVHEEMVEREKAARKKAAKVCGGCGGCGGCLCGVGVPCDLRPPAPASLCL